AQLDGKQRIVEAVRGEDGKAPQLLHRRMVLVLERARHARERQDPRRQIRPEQRDAQCDSRSLAESKQQRPGRSRGDLLDRGGRAGSTVGGATMRPDKEATSSPRSEGSTGLATCAWNPASIARRTSWGVA